MGRCGRDPPDIRKKQAGCSWRWGGGGAAARAVARILLWGMPSQLGGQSGTGPPPPPGIVRLAWPLVDVLLLDDSTYGFTLFLSRSLNAKRTPHAEDVFLGLDPV